MKDNQELTEFEQGIQERAKLYSNLLVHHEFIEQFDQTLSMLLRAIKENKKILIFGNGGSAAEAQHFAGELVCQFAKKRKAIAAIALTANSSILTAQSNDYEFETVFSRQIEALCQPGDVVIGLTTSDAQVSDTWHGHSCNILRAFDQALTKGCRTVGLFSVKTKFLLDFVHVAIVIPSTETALVQEVHLMLIHELSDHIERAL